MIKKIEIQSKFIGLMSFFIDSILNLIILPFNCFNFKWAKHLNFDKIGNLIWGKNLN